VRRTKLRARLRMERYLVIDAWIRSASIRGHARICHGTGSWEPTGSLMAMSGEPAPAATFGNMCRDRSRFWAQAHATISSGGT
jgi:hypothetical protein